MWPFRTKAEAPPPERKSVGGFFLGGPLLQPPAASYGRLAREGYGQNPVAFACANRIAGAVASVEPQLFRRKGGKVERVDESDLIKLIERPNSQQSGREFFGHLASYYTLSGNAYVLGIGPGVGGKGRPRELQLLSPGHVEVVPGRVVGIPDRYEYRPDANTRRLFPVDRITGRSDLLHVKTFHPLSPWVGMAPMDAAALAIDMHNAGSVWNYSLLKRGARPSGALMMKGGEKSPPNLTEAQFERTRQQVDEQFSGSANAGRPLLLEGGLEWQEMSLSPKDIDFLEGKHSAAREIALAFGVPPQLLGIPGDATYSNMAEARLALWTDTVLPLMQLVYGGLNRWLAPLFGDGLYLWYDEEMIPALEPLRKQKADRINAATYLTPDEKREAMGLEAYKSPPKTGAGSLFVPRTQVPIEVAGRATPASETDDKPDEGEAQDPA